jgi:uncharacterized protein with HEPN domain
MPKRDSTLLIEDIKTAISRVEKYTAGFDRQHFLADDKTVDAVVRNLEIIGEASRQLPDAFKESHSSIPWHKIAGLRNRIVHDYFGVDLQLIWQIISIEIPSLKDNISVID